MPGRAARRGPRNELALADLVRIANATIADIGTPGRARFSGGDMYQRM